MFCRNCGKEINNDAVLCVNCGTLINGAVFNSLTVQPAPTVAAPETATDAPIKNRLATVGFILSCLGILGWTFSVVGLVLSIVGLVQSRKLKTGKGYGIAGIVLSVVTFILHTLILMVILPYLAGLAMVVILLLVMI